MAGDDYGVGNQRGNRHTHTHQLSTWESRCTGPLPAVSARLRHGSVRRTQETYSHMIHKQDDAAARKWEEFQNQIQSPSRALCVRQEGNPRLRSSSAVNERNTSRPFRFTIHVNVTLVKLPDAPRDVRRPGSLAGSYERFRCRKFGSTV